MLGFQMLVGASGFGYTFAKLFLVVFVLARAFQQYLLAFKMVSLHFSLHHYSFAFLQVCRLVVPVNHLGLTSKAVDGMKNQVIRVINRVKFNVGLAESVTVICTEPST